VLFCYLAISYLILPATWSRIEHEPGLSQQTMLTATAQGIPGDPINLGLIGTREDVVSAFHAAGWYPADPITLRTSVEIVGSVLLDRPYKNAPVSPLFFEGRREDLAFEKPHGGSADRRQHVRLWLVIASGADAAPVWLASATFDSGVTLSRDTGQVTHKIAPNVDEERDRLIGDLNRAQMVTRIYQAKGSGPTLNGRNGEGDPYYSDGEIWLARLVSARLPFCLKPWPGRGLCQAFKLRLIGGLKRGRYLGWLVYRGAGVGLTLGDHAFAPFRRPVASTTIGPSPHISEAHQDSARNA